MRAAGAIPNKVDLWLRWGWVRAPENDRHGWSLSRSVLDPMLRRLAADTPGVDYLPGLGAIDVLGDADAGRVRGVRVRMPNGEERDMRARLVVAADGRESSMGKFARVPARIRPHGRFGYFAYFEDVPLPDPQRAVLDQRPPTSPTRSPTSTGSLGSR
jgi:2-polyprenyl-6-methoxyphenol hydroxylase-like FAD-dependent oxidoreductase